MFYVYGPLFYTELWCIKIAIILLYYSMINSLFPKLRIALHVILTFTITGYLTAMAMSLFWCTPISNNWTLDESKMCWSGGAYVPYFTGLGFHFISDTMSKLGCFVGFFLNHSLALTFQKVFAWPFFLLKFLHLSQTARLGVIGMFALGAACICCTIARAISIGFGASIPKVNAWQGAEMTIAIMVICCPSIKLLLNNFGQRSVKNVNENESGGSNLQLQKDRENDLGFVNIKSIELNTIDKGGYINEARALA